MSDSTVHANLDEQPKPQIQAPEATTDLVPAVEAEHTSTDLIPASPNHPVIPEDEEPKESPKRRGLGVGAIVVAGAVVLAGGAAALLKQNSHPKVVNPEATAVHTPDTNPTPTTTEVIKKSSLDATNILPGDRTIAFTRKNGELVDVALPRDPSKNSAQLVAESDWAAIDAYLSSDGNEVLLSQIAGNDTVKTYLRQQRQQAISQYWSLNIPNLQVTTADPESGAKPVYTPGDSGQVVLTSGNLVVNLTSDPQWQGQDKSFNPNLPEYTVTSSSFTNTLDSDGHYKISQISFKIS